jgi:hypothetical protein
VDRYFAAFVEEAQDAVDIKVNQAVKAARLAMELLNDRVDPS